MNKISDTFWNHPWDVGPMNHVKVDNRHHETTQKEDHGSHSQAMCTNNKGLYIIYLYPYFVASLDTPVNGIFLSNFCAFNELIYLLITITPLITPIPLVNNCLWYGLFFVKMLLILLIYSGMFSILEIVA